MLFRSSSARCWEACPVVPRKVGHTLAPVAASATCWARSLAARAASADGTDYPRRACRHPRPARRSGCGGDGLPQRSGARPHRINLGHGMARDHANRSRRNRRTGCRRSGAAELERPAASGPCRSVPHRPALRRLTTLLSTVRYRTQRDFSALRRSCNNLSRNKTVNVGEIGTSRSTKLPAGALVHPHSCAATGI